MFAIQNFQIKEGFIDVKHGSNTFCVKTGVKSKKKLMHMGILGVASANQKLYNGDLIIPDENFITEEITSMKDQHCGIVSGPYFAHGRYYCTVTYSPGKIQDYEIAGSTAMDALRRSHIFITYFYEIPITAAADAAAYDNIAAANNYLNLMLKSSHNIMMGKGGDGASDASSSSSASAKAATNAVSEAMAVASVASAAANAGSINSSSVDQSILSCAMTLNDVATAQDSESHLDLPEPKKAKTAKTASCII